MKIWTYYVDILIMVVLIALLLTHYDLQQHMTLNWVNIALGYGLLLHAATPLLEPVMLYHQGMPVTVNRENFRWKLVNK